MTLTVLTWNIQGRERPDVDAVSRVIAEAGPDVVLLQEVQRRQARDVAARLDMQVEWCFKHWPVVHPAEGLAVLAGRDIEDVARIALAHRWALWSWKRRVAITARIQRTTVVNTHLGAGVGDEERARQAGLTVIAARRGPAIVGGDLNASPGSGALNVYAAAGFEDGWGMGGGEGVGATNWPPGPRDEAPTQRLDYVFVRGHRSVSASLPGRDEAVSLIGPLSDHLPLTVTVEGTDDK